jgi:hypothetical protein
MKKEKTDTAKAKKSIKIQPDMKWQTGDYSRHHEFHFTLPYQFLLLCKLVDTPPEQLIRDFMDNLSCASWKREGRDKAKSKLMDYFIEHGYGQHHYSVEDLQTILRELDAIGMLWPSEAKEKMMELHSEWRAKYHRYWFRKWFRKPRRK